MNIGERITEIRNSKNISIYKLAKLSDVAENHIRAIEKGKNQPTLLTLDKILNSLGVNLSEFFNDTNECLYPNEYERNLLEAIRNLDNEQADAVLKMIKLFNKNQIK